MNTQRLEKVLKKMETEGLEQMIISDPYAIYYLTGRFIDPGERLLALYINQSGKNKIFINNLFTVPEDLGVEKFRFSDTDDYLTPLCDCVEAGKPLGIDKTFAARFLIPVIDHSGASSYKVSSICIDEVRIYDYNFRTYLNTLASVKYMGVAKKNTATIPYGYKKVQETKNKYYSIYENQYSLPLGYTYDKIVNADRIDQYSAAEKQETTMLAAIVEDKDMDKNSNLTVATKLPLTAQKLKIKNIKLNGVSMTKDTIEIEKPGATMKFSFEAPANAETYLSLVGDIYAEKDAKEHFITARIKAPGVKYGHKFRIDAYTTGQKEYLFNLGYREGAVKTCTLKFVGTGTLKYKDLAIYSQTMSNYADRVNALKENSLKNAKAEKNTVTGNITVDKDKMLVVTLPYQKGWTAYVDGKKTDIQRVNYQYIGINLKKGTHDIKLHYQLPGIKLAFMITGCGIIAFVAIIIFNIVRKRRKN